VFLKAGPSIFPDAEEVKDQFLDTRTIRETTYPYGGYAHLKQAGGLVRFSELACGDKVR